MNRRPVPEEACDQIVLDGVTIAPGVVETVVAIAAESVEGVAGVCARTAFRRATSMPAIDVALIEGALFCDVHVIAFYGYVLPELGIEVQRAVRHALDAQMGIAAAAIDIYIDGIAFED